MVFLQSLHSYFWSQFWTKRNHNEYYISSSICYCKAFWLWESSRERNCGVRSPINISFKLEKQSIITEDRLSEFSMVLKQGIIFTCLMISLSTVFYLFVKDVRNLVILLAMIVLSLLLLINFKLYYSCADVYVSSKSIILKKLFGEKIISISDIQSVEVAVLQYYYFVCFKDGSKVYFKIRMKYVNIKLFVSVEEGILPMLKKKFRLE